jgi:hypothetical protein
VLQFVFVGGLVEDTPHAKVAILDVTSWMWLELTLADEDLRMPDGRCVKLYCQHMGWAIRL